MTKPILLVTAIALRNAEGQILLAQRPEGKHMAGLWEFPGGKVHDDETPEQSLVREMKEELNISVQTENLVPLTFASHTYDSFHLFMPLFGCARWQGDIKAMEHTALAWVFPHDFGSYPMPPADAPLASFLIKWSGVS